MAEKGGKGLSLPKGGKSARKSSLYKEGVHFNMHRRGAETFYRFFVENASLKGKDDSSVKSKRGRKVQFDSEGSPDTKINVSSKFGWKTDTPVTKGDWSKGGKGDKTVNDAKSSVSKDSLPLELKVEHELPKNAKCLMDCEAAHVLQGIQEQMVILSEDPTIRLPVAFDRGLQYAKTGNHYTSPQSVRQILEALTKHGISDGEMCMIANICPETVDEVFSLIPSLKDKRSKLKEPLKDVLSELAMLKRSDITPGT